MKIKLRTNEKPLQVHTQEGYIIKINNMGLGAIIPGECDPTVPDWIKTLKEDDLFILNCGDAFRDLEGGLSNP